MQGYIQDDEVTRLAEELRSGLSSRAGLMVVAGLLEELLVLRRKVRNDA
jgi:hypothetical protein